MKLLRLSALAAVLMSSLLAACSGLLPGHGDKPLAAAGPDTTPAPESTQAAGDAGRAIAIQQIAQSPWGVNTLGARWEHFGVPGKQATRFTYEVVDGRHAVVADARSSASLLRKTVRVEPQSLERIRFSWKVPALIPTADMSHRDKDDSPVRIVLAFDGDRSRFSPRDMLLAELTRAITGEEMPYATLMYAWSNTAPVGSVINNPRTDRIRKLVLESGPESLGRWRDYERDVRADFERAFGEPAGALVGVAIMTDTDNTRSVAQAWYGPVQVMTRPRGRAVASE